MKTPTVSRADTRVLGAPHRTGQPVETAPAVGPTRHSDGFDSGSGRHPTGSLTGVEAAWTAVRAPIVTINELRQAGEPLLLMLAGERTVSVSASAYAQGLVASGAVKLYRDPKASFDGDERGRRWRAAYYLVPTSQSVGLFQGLSSLAQRSAAATKRLNQEFARCEKAMHASNVNGVLPFNLTAVKNRVFDRIPRAEAALTAFEEAAHQIGQASDRLTSEYAGSTLDLLAREAVANLAPHRHLEVWSNLDFARQLFCASRLLLNLPHVEAVYGKDTLRVFVNTDTLVKSSQTYAAFERQVRALLRANRVSAPLEIVKNNNETGALAAARSLLRDVVGTRNVVTADGQGDLDFKDGTRGTEFTLFVKTAVLEEARKQIPELVSLFERHGFNKKHLKVTIESETAL